MELPLREQGTLLTVVRGCDLTPKFPLDSLERRLVAALRYAFMVPADVREVDSEPGCFMISEPPKDFRASALDHYPQHWVSHIIHAVEVIAYRHPVDKTAYAWQEIYKSLCDSLHLNVETPAQFLQRMSEDRIQKGNVVQ